MSTWIKNFRSALKDKEVIILHCNVRDKYVDTETTEVFSNLTSLIKSVASSMDVPNDKDINIIYYDIVKGETREHLNVVGKANSDESANQASKASPETILAKWQENELKSTEQNTFAVIYYLDKLVSYSERYQADEQRILIRLEKIIENITPNNRLILVCLRDTLIPIELWSNSPRTRVLSIPIPDKEDRNIYIQKSKDGYSLSEYMAELTDGLYLTDLDNLIKELPKIESMNKTEVRKLVNKYRLGEQQDYWGKIDDTKLKHAVTWFKKTIKGQDEAINRVVQTLLLARSGLSGMASGTVSKPKGTLFFAGPSGVGKTHTAKKLAEFLFGSEDYFIRLDMSEFMEEHTVSKMIGSPPGYIGSDKGGMLTDAVKQKPFSVILFDEIEKAHPKIMDVFLQLIDEGRLTDSRGQTVFFTETIIIFTSNIGARTMTGGGTMKPGEKINERSSLDKILADNSKDENQKKAAIQKHFVKSVENFFLNEISRPELLNRVGTNIVPFNFIRGEEQMVEMLQSHLDRTKLEFEDRFKQYKYSINYDPLIINYIIKKHGEDIQRFGGRRITNAIEDELFKPLSESLLLAQFNNEDNIKFSMYVDDQIVPEIRVEKN